MSKILTVEELAAMHGLDVRYARRLCATGKVPATRIGKRVWAINESDAAAFAKSARGRPKKVVARKRISRKSRGNAELRT